MRYTLCLSFVTLALVVGCGTQAGENKTPEGSPVADKKSDNKPEKTAADAAGAKADDKAPKSDEKGPKKVELKTLSADQVFALIKKKTGKVVVVDCWSTWCEPCKKEFPGLLKLQEKYGDRMAAISVCLNFSGAAGEKPEDGREDVLKFLNEQKATIDNALSSTPDEEFYQAVKKEFKLPEAPAGVPIILVFDQQGKLVKRWDTTTLSGEGKFSYPMSVEPIVEKLVKQ
jgi:thiol-disulfide isomerase/thioredoxin